MATTRSIQKQWMGAGINAQQFWNIAFSSKTEIPKSAFLTIEDAQGDKELEEKIRFCNEKGIISRHLEYLFRDVIRKGYSWFVLFPVLCQNSTLSSKNKEELKCQVTTIKSLQFKINLSDKQEEKLELQEQLDEYKIVQGKTLLFDDGCCYSLNWSDKIGLNFYSCKKPRSFFLRNNRNTINATYISMPELTRQEILEQSFEDSLFRFYLISSNPRFHEKFLTEFKKDRSKEKNLSSE